MPDPNKIKELKDDQRDLKRSYREMMPTDAGMDLNKYLLDILATENAKARAEMDNPNKAVMHLQRAAICEQILSHIAGMLS